MTTSNHERLVERTRRAVALSPLPAFTRLAGAREMRGAPGSGPAGAKDSLPLRGGGSGRGFADLAAGSSSPLGGGEGEKGTSTSTSPSSSTSPAPSPRPSPPLRGGEGENGTPSRDPPPPGGSSESPALEARSLVKRFGATEALRGLSFAVAPGQLYGLVGPDGAGKTTLIRA